MTILIDLVVAVVAGCVVAVCFFVIRMYQTRSSCKRSYCFGKFWKESIAHVVIGRPDRQTIQFMIQGPFFFGVAQKLEHVFLSVAHEQVTEVIFNFQDVPFIDITGATVFSKVVKLYRQQGCKVYVEAVNDRILRKFKKMKID